MRSGWLSPSIAQAPASQDYEGRNQRAAGSNSVRVYWQPMRRAGATARDLLRRAAAELWQVSEVDALKQFEQNFERLFGVRP